MVLFFLACSSAPAPEDTDVSDDTGGDCVETVLTETDLYKGVRIDDILAYLSSWEAPATYGLDSDLIGEALPATTLQMVTAPTGPPVLEECPEGHSVVSVPMTLQFSTADEILGGTNEASQLRLGARVSSLGNPDIVLMTAVDRADWVGSWQPGSDFFSSCEAVKLHFTNLLPLSMELEGVRGEIDLALEPPLDDLDGPCNRVYSLLDW